MHDLAIVVATQNGVDLKDQVMIRTIARRVGAALWHQRAKDVVRSVQEHGQFMHWAITD